jgi:hypothetical protein
LRLEAERLNRAYDSCVNQHRKIRLPPDDPAEAYRRFMPERPGGGLWAVAVALLSAFALSAVPDAAAHPLAVLSPCLAAMGVSLWAIASRLSRLAGWRREARRAEELKEGAIAGRSSAVEAVLAGVLSEVDWIRETSASFEASPCGGYVSVDVGLPAMEDLERYDLVCRNAASGLERVPKRQWVVEREYQLQVHAILLRIAGEVFYHFPTVRQVAASGWTGRPDPGSGGRRAEYIISAVFDRARWILADPAAADPVECVGRFPVRREIGEGAYMAPISPFRFDTV